MTNYTPHLHTSPPKAAPFACVFGAIYDSPLRYSLTVRFVRLGPLLADKSNLASKRVMRQEAW